MNNPAGWYQDPTHRHWHRYWDGGQWTPHVADGGQQTTDSDLTPAPPPQWSTAPPPASIATYQGSSCSTCRQPTGPGAACPFCGQVVGLPAGIKLSSPAKRLGGIALDYVFLLVTLGLGWLIWSMIIWSRGQTPAKQLLKMRVVKVSTRQKATWGTMALRELVGKGLIMQGLGLVTLGIAPLVLYFMVLWDRDRQELWDKIADTIVVDDPIDQLA